MLQRTLQVDVRQRCTLQQLLGALQAMLRAHGISAVLAAGKQQQQQQQQQKRVAAKRSGTVGI